MLLSLVTSRVTGRRLGMLRAEMALASLPGGRKEGGREGEEGGREGGWEGGLGECVWAELMLLSLVMSRVTGRRLEC